MKQFIALIKKLIFAVAIPLFSMAIDIDINKASEDVNKTQKHVVLFLHKDNCGYCEKMLFQLEEKEISEIIKKDFILLDINRDDDETVAYQDFNGTNQQFLKALGVNFYPAMVFINGSNAEIIYNIRGYRNSKKIITTLNYINSNSYKKMSMEEFKDELSFNE